MKIAAEIQFNNSCEIASVPYLPVMDLVAEHLHNLAPVKLDGMFIGLGSGAFRACQRPPNTMLTGSGCMLYNLADS